MEKNKIFIPGNVPSSKNSKQWTGKFLVNSKAVQRYIKESKPFWLENKNKFKEMSNGLRLPLVVSFCFIRGSRRKFDYINPAQTVNDLMVKYNWIQDDDCCNILPVFEPYKYDKNKPGVTIKILKNG